MASARNTGNLIGIASIVLGIFVFSAQDAIIKLLSSGYALTLAIAVRGLVSFPILLAMVHFECGLDKLRTANVRFLVLRGLILLTSYTSFYMAFPALPLAEAITLFFMAPLVVTILSGPMLGEKISLWSWAAVVLGLVGVMVILQPGSALFEPAALLSLISAVTYAIAMVLARKHGTHATASVMAFYQNGVYLTGALVFAGVVALLEPAPFGHPSVDFLMRPWELPNSFDLFLLCFAGVIAAAAMPLLTHGYRVGSANLVTIFEYTGMIWASLWGYLLFAEVPKMTTFIGMALIAAAGLISLRASAAKA